MILRLVLLFTLVPLAELYLFVEIGARVGVWPTIALVVFTGALGAALTRFEGLRVFREVQLELQQGRVPTQHLLDGLLILLAGVVLLTPGLITDLAGFFLLAPRGRRLVREALTNAVRRRFKAPSPGVIDARWHRDDDPSPGP